MAWYVFALVDAVPSGGAGKGLTGALSLRKLAGAFVVVERRADVPPIAFGTLKEHQDVVSRLAKQVPAILPVRFGTLLETPDLEEAVQERAEEIAEAFDLVRDRMQFTWRISGSRKPEAGSRKPESKAVSGAEYLRQAARAANPPPPPAFRALRSRLAPLAVRQRYQPATAALPEAVYHLVAASDVHRYIAAAAGVDPTSPPLAMTGPFAPFAFAPEIL
jgi:Gas vesicle synthesis protein GvpL/GvpF